MTDMAGETHSDRVVRLPTLQLIGAQKAGTSAIADWLFEYGSFCRPIVFEGEPDYYSKEVHFFDIEYRYYKGVQFYGRRFSPRTDRCCGGPYRTIDATPGTLSSAERVRSTYEEAGGGQANEIKIIVILREPVSRELSLYNHLAFDCRHLKPAEQTEWHKQVLGKDGRRVLSFDEFVSNVSLPALTREAGLGQSTRHSLYAIHLQKWFHLFDRKQILVLSYDELLKNPERLQERIQSFLSFSIPGRLKRANANDGPHKIKSPSAETSRVLQEVFSSYNEDLYRLLESTSGPSMEQRPFPRFSS